ncbi:MAG: N-acetylglucosamine kinase [Flavihumibacter sp.]
MAILIADSGATKCEWTVVERMKGRKTAFTLGISPYFLNEQQIRELVQRELLPEIAKYDITAVHYYGTGCKSADNRKLINRALSAEFRGAKVTVETDLLAAARSVCGHDKGIACILGTGCNSAYYNGTKVAKNSPGLGYVLGDEGSGAYLGKKVLQYYMYNTFDEELRYRFDEKFGLTEEEILDRVYKQPLPNRFLAGFTLFRAENRGHFMVENIIEDGLNDFFFYHLNKYNESWKHPVHFVGSVAFGFRDVITELCNSYEFELGKIVQNPMSGLIHYHAQ